VGSGSGSGLAAPVAPAASQIFLFQCLLIALKTNSCLPVKVCSTNCHALEDNVSAMLCALVLVQPRSNRPRLLAVFLTQMFCLLLYAAISPASSQCSVIIDLLLCRDWCSSQPMGQPAGTLGVWFTHNKPQNFNRLTSSLYPLLWPVACACWAGGFRRGGWMGGDGVCSVAACCCVWGDLQLVG